MKKFFIGFLLICFFSCSEFAIEERQRNFEEQSEKAVSEDGHRVAYADIVKLTNGRNAKTRSASQSTTEIECLTSSLNDTLLYVEKKHDGGWIMYVPLQLKYQS